MERGTSFCEIMVRRGIPIPYVPIRDGTRSKCDGNDVPGTLFRNEECVPNYLVLGRELESLLFFFAGLLSHVNTCP